MNPLLENSRQNARRVPSKDVIEAESSGDK